MSYQHLSIEERCCIREYYRQGLSYREIARSIGRNVSTVSREIRRNRSFQLDRAYYYPHTAQKKYQLRRKFCHRGMFRDEKVVSYVTERLRETWSPEQIAGTPCEGMDVPSFKTIYRWIDKKYILNGSRKVLRRKGRKGALETRGKFNKGKSIRMRDPSVKDRKEAGHWELDTVVSGRGKSPACFATFLERKTRYYIACWIPNRTADVMEDAIVEVLSSFPRGMVKTLTCDRGTEFANWQSIEDRLGCDLYFADPYCAWQKGSNENSNGLLREFYPKGHSLARVSKATLKKNLALLNARPRKILGFKSPMELFESELLKLTECCT